jgi:hypothetical protein
MRAPAVFLVLVAACGRGNKTPPGAKEAGAPAPTIYPSEVAPQPLAVRFCEALHKLPAERVAACCGSATTTSLAGECTRLLSASLADGVVELAAEAVDACVSATKRELEGCGWVTPGVPPPPKECVGLLRGTVTAGGACRSHLDCSGNAHCLGGTCVAPEPIGARCGVAVDQLATLTRQNDVEKRHATCAEHCSLVTHKCEAMPTVGTECFSSAGCAEGQTCVGGKCSASPPGKENEPCSGATCAKGLRCAEKRCVPLAREGEPCASDFDCARGGCSAHDGGRVCGATCTHAGDLTSIAKALASSAPRDAGPR